MGMKLFENGKMGENEDQDLHTCTRQARLDRRKRDASSGAPVVASSC
jgi:hypothetical protein